MASDPSEIHAETDAARAGSTPNVVRWILAISLLAVIVLLSLVWMTGALRHAEDSAIEGQGQPADTGAGQTAGGIEAAPAAIATTEN